MLVTTTEIRHLVWLTKVISLWEFSFDLFGPYHFKFSFFNPNSFVGPNQEIKKLFEEAEKKANKE